MTHQGCSVSGESSAILEPVEEACAVGAGGIGRNGYATTANNLVPKGPAGAQEALYASVGELLGAPGGVRCARCGRTGALLQDPRMFAV